jgi:hypothetical protein
LFKYSLQKEKKSDENRQHSKYQNDKLDNQSAKSIKEENTGNKGRGKVKKDSKRMAAKRAEWKPKGQDDNSSKGKQI